MPSLRRLLPCLFALLALPLTASAQGVLAPASAPAPTLKTLAQIEPHTPVGTVGGSTVLITISQPGSYVLMGNLTVGNTHGISITTNNVTLDLNGFVIACNHPAATTNAAISISSSLKGIVIRNGIISGGTTYSAGAFTPLGFGYGVYCATGGFATVEKLSVSGACVSGIFLPDGISKVSDCNVSTCVTAGIRATNIRNCQVREVGRDGIFASEVVDGCVAEVVSGGSAIDGRVVSNSTGRTNGAGTGITAFSATNCEGSTLSGPYGMNTGNATNCHGTNQTGGYGLYATNAMNCWGDNGSGGAGLYAKNATNCFARNTSGPYAIQAVSATNCYGDSAPSQYALYCRIAIGCSTGTGLSYIENKYNMP